MSPTIVVERLYRYPVKSMQGSPVETLAITATGVVGDRTYALIDRSTGTLMSAKRWSRLLTATADDDGVSLPNGERHAYDDPATNGALSAWLDRDVELRRAGADEALSYEMTFDPPNDDSEYYEIPAPAGTFLDAAALHLVSRQTLEGCATSHPELSWDVRRFRPNILVGAEDLEPFGEDEWCGQQVRIGEAVVAPANPTVRCAMPLRAQPGLERQPGLYHAMEAVHANHLGIYIDVVEPGTVRVGDAVQPLATS